MSRVPQTAVLLTVLCSAACNDRESPPTAPPEPTVSAAADISPDTRQFGLGLLIGGALTGIVTAGLCSTMLGSRRCWDENEAGVKTRPG